eukprot:scpid96365/ scgid34310/ 
MSLVTAAGIAEFFSDETKRIERGENALDSQRLEHFLYDGTSKVINAKVKARMRNRVYDVKITLGKRNILSGECECARGRARCHHMAVALLYAQKNVSSTDTECRWIKRKSKDEVKFTAMSSSRTVRPVTSYSGHR